MDPENGASEKNGDSFMHDAPADDGVETGMPAAAPVDEQLSKAMNSVIYSDVRALLLFADNGLMT